MAREGSVAPKERVNITYKSAASGDADVELPFKMLMLGDYTGRPDDTPVEERKAISVDKDNFADVMRDQKLSADASVKDVLSADGGDMNVHLEFRSLDDFTPDGIARQVPALQKLLELRSALSALKGPLGNVPAFRKRIQAILADPAARQRLLAELGLGEPENKE